MPVVDELLELDRKRVEGRREQRQQAEKYQRTLDACGQRFGPEDYR